jgi:putative ABC transport system substrate-binding protein
MKRREFIALSGAAICPCPTWAQQPVTIGILNFENPEPLRTMLREGLRELGYTEGRNLRVEFRSAEGSRDRLSGLAAELVGLKVEVLVAYPTPAAVAIKEATREIPIVMLATGDPVGTGLVASLARPGGNIIGTSSTTSELGSKTLDVIRDIIPSVQRVAVLANAIDPFTTSFLEQIELGRQTLPLEIQTLLVNDADELDVAFVAIKKNAAEAVIVQPSLPRARVIDLALKNRVPSSSRPSSTSSSISRPRRRSVSPFLPTSSPAPTR